MEGELVRRSARTSWENRKRKTVRGPVFGGKGNAKKGGPFSL